MKTKKSKKANLERKRFLLFEIGLLLALAIVFSSFEIGKTETKSGDFGVVSWDIDDNADILITYPPDIPEPVEPEIIEKPKIPDELEIVPDDAEEDVIDPGTEDLGDPVSPYVYEPVQVEKKEPLEIIDWVLVENKPEFEGGEEGLFKFIANNTEYPEIPKTNGVSGKVYVQFVIDENGKVTAVEALNAIDPYLCREAERVISLLPDWKPGTQRNQAVPVKFIIPINFVLN